MKENEKKMIIILSAITLLLIIVFIRSKGKENQKKEENILPKEEFVTVMDDGSRVNKSSMLKKTKIIDGLEIGNITLKESGNESVIRATVKNTTSIKKGDEFIQLTIIDKDGNTLVKVKGYLNTINPGEKTELNIKASCDFANAYDFKVN